MTAKGKINASNVQTGDRILVETRSNGTIHPSSTKTGEFVSVARVLGKTFRAAQGPYEARGKYIVMTTSGSFEAAPIQTMWLAPEDPAGIKRAHVEALELDKVYEAYPLASDQVCAVDECGSDEDVVVTVTRAIVNQGATDIYNEAYRLTGDRESALGDLHDQASREDGSRLQVALAGKSWATHFVKFDGTVLPRELTLHSHDGKVVLNSEDDNKENEMTTEQALAALKEIDEMKIEVTSIGGDEPEQAEMTTQTETTENHTGSTVVALLERVWGRIRENHPELPEVVIITGSGLLGGSKWGHFRADGWKADQERRHELFLAGEALAKGARQVLQTMIHEAAHTISKVRGIQDTSRQGRWHNKEFKKAAEELGLEHKAASADSSHGYSFVTLTDRTVEKYADLLEELDREIKLTCHLPLWLGGSTDEDDKGGEKITGKAPKGEDEKKTQSGPIKATCNCEEPNIIRASRKVLDKRVISCEDCDSVFRAAD